MTITYRNLGLYGRLGNALFELAATIGIAEAHGEDVVLPSSWMHRPYFSVPDELFGPIPVDAKEATEFVSYLDPRACPYLQDVNLFIGNALDRVRGYLKPSVRAQEILSGYVLPEHPRLGVHVRRGDNVYDPGVPNKSDYHVCPPLDYYQRGMDLAPPMNVCVFSDDIQWCRDHIPAVFYGSGIAHPKEHEPDFLATEPMDWIDLFLLASCDRFVISGSTFGIWGALLSHASPDDVVRPDRVFGPIVAAYTNAELMFPPGWKTLHVA